MTEGSGFLIRPAREGDLDVITGFEIDIARVSFGTEAIEDPELHRKRVAAALGKPGEVTLVAVTKTVPLEVAALLPRLGVTNLGESRPQELWHKAAALPAGGR